MSCWKKPTHFCSNSIARGFVLLFTSSAYIYLDPLVELWCAVYFTRGSKRPGGPFSYQGVQILSLFQPGGLQGNSILTQKQSFLDPLVTTGFAGEFFLTQNQPFFGSPGCSEPDRFFIFLPIAGGEIRFCNWFVAFLNSKV